MCSVFIIYRREDSRNAAAINFFVNIRSRRGWHGAQTENALPTGAIMLRLPSISRSSGHRGTTIIRLV